MHRWPLRALTLALVVGTTSAALARPMSGRFGIGAQMHHYSFSNERDPYTGETYTAAVSALSVRYWVSDLGLQVQTGLEIGGKTPEGEKYNDYFIAVHMLYNFSRTRQTNLAIGAGISTLISSDIDSDDTPLYLDIILAPEFHISEHLALSAHVTASIELGGDGTQLLRFAPFGLSFHYYF